MSEDTHSSDNVIPFPAPVDTQDKSKMVMLTSDDGMGIGASIANYMFMQNLKEHVFIVKMAYPDGRVNYFGIVAQPVPVPQEIIDELIAQDNPVGTVDQCVAEEDEVPQ